MDGGRTFAAAPASTLPDGFVQTSYAHAVTDSLLEPRHVYGITWDNGNHGWIYGNGFIIVRFPSLIASRTRAPLVPRNCPSVSPPRACHFRQGFSAQALDFLRCCVSRLPTQRSPRVTGEPRGPGRPQRTCGTPPTASRHGERNCSSRCSLLCTAPCVRPFSVLWPDPLSRVAPRLAAGHLRGECADRGQQMRARRR